MSGREPSQEAILYLTGWSEFLSIQNTLAWYSVKGKVSN